MSSEPRWDDMIRSGRHSHRRAPRRWPKFLFYSAMLFVILMLIAGGVVWAAIHKRPSHVALDVAEVSQGGPRNVLILGSDSRADLTPAELKKYDPTGKDRNSGHRSDTIILLNIDPKRDKAVIVSFPRDLRVTKPDGRIGKINSVYQQGPAAMVKMIETYSGMKINNYIEIDFAGFKKIVDALGGVDIYFEQAINEPNSGLRVPKGCVHLAGDQALSFVRVRKVDSDFGRIARQQLFVKLLMKKVLTPSNLLHPFKLLKLADLFTKNVKTDQNLSLGTEKDLALKLRGIDAGKVDMRVLPSAPKNIGGVSFVVANQQQVDSIFQALRDRKPLPDYGRTGVSALQPSDIRVSVLNGTGLQELAKTEGAKLTSAGFADVATGNATPIAKTTVFFKEGNEEKAKLLAERYKAQVKPMPSTIVVDTELALVLGKDFGAPAAPTPAQPTPRSPGAAQPKPSHAPVDPLVKPFARECT